MDTTHRFRYWAKEHIVFREQKVESIPILCVTARANRFGVVRKRKLYYASIRDDGVGLDTMAMAHKCRNGYWLSVGRFILKTDGFYTHIEIPG